MTPEPKQTASERIQVKLEKEILDRRYRPGDRLPSERELQERMGVGRGTVREAYRALQEKGLIETRHGGGAYVREVDSSQVADNLSLLIRHKRVSTMHLFEFREALESRAVAYACERATREQLAGLRRNVDRLEKALQSGGGTTDFYQQEIDLHTELARMSGNPLYEWIADTFRQNSVSYSESYSQLDLIRSHQPREVIADWRMLLKALEKREVTRAVMIMRSHLFHFRQLLGDSAEFAGG